MTSDGKNKLLQKPCERRPAGKLSSYSAVETLSGRKEHSGQRQILSSVTLEAGVRLAREMRFRGVAQQTSGTLKRQAEVGDEIRV